MTGSMSSELEEVIEKLTLEGKELSAVNVFEYSGKNQSLLVEYVSLLNNDPFAYIVEPAKLKKEMLEQLAVRKFRSDER